MVIVERRHVTTPLPRLVYAGDPFLVWQRRKVAGGTTIFRCPSSNFVVNNSRKAGHQWRRASDCRSQAAERFFNCRSVFVQINHVRIPCAVGQRWRIPSDGAEIEVARMVPYPGALSSEGTRRSCRSPDMATQSYSELVVYKMWKYFLIQLTPKNQEN